MVTVESGANAVAHRIMCETARCREPGWPATASDHANGVTSLEDLLRSHSRCEIARLEATTRRGFDIQLDVLAMSVAAHAMPERERSFNDLLDVDRWRRTHANHPFNSF